LRSLTGLACYRAFAKVGAGGTGVGIEIMLTPMFRWLTG
jgi:hypothetical protein